MPERRLSKRGELVDHSVGRVALEGSKQCLDVECVGDDRRDAEFDQPTAAVLAAGQPEHLMPVFNESTGDRCTQSAGCSGKQNLHDLPPISADLSEPVSCAIAPLDSD